MLRILSGLVGILMCFHVFAGSESRGLVSAVDLESNQITIDNKIYPMPLNEVQVFYQDRKVSASDLLPDTFVRFSVSSSGVVEKIWLIGLEEKVKNHFQH